MAAIFDPATDGLPDLGPCCMCERSGEARNIIMLDRRCVIAGHGWGCVVCGPPPDGAYAVLCDHCMEIYQADRSLLTTACRGYPASEGRVAIAVLPGPFGHDLTKHPELQQPPVSDLAANGVRACRVCGCTDDDCRGCVERTGEACYWVEPGLCSACADNTEAGAVTPAQRDLLQSLARRERLVTHRDIVAVCYARGWIKPVRARPGVGPTGYRLSRSGRRALREEAS